MKADRHAARGVAMLLPVIACLTCTADITDLRPRAALPIVHATIVAGQPLHLVSVEWAANGTTFFTRDSLAAPDTAAQVQWTTPEGQLLAARPLWHYSGSRRDHGIYAVGAIGADSALLAPSRYQHIATADLPRLDLAAVPGRYELRVVTSRGDIIRGSIVVHPRRTRIRTLQVSGTAADTLVLHDSMPSAMPISVATITSRENYATVISDRGTLRVPLDAPGRTDRAVAMFPAGETSRLVHYALDSALARSFWGASDPLHAGGRVGNLSGALGVAGYAVPMTIAYVTRSAP